MRRLWVVSYDISDERRRTRLANALLGWGDRLWLVPVCAKCRTHAWVNGQHRGPDDPPWHIV